MKILCKGEYHNGPAGLHFAEAGQYSVDDAVGEFLLRDAPENFQLLPDPEPELPASAEPVAAAPAAPPADRAVRSPRGKRGQAGS